MKSLLAPFVLPWLRRDPGEIARRAASFRIQTDDGRQLVASLGAAFLQGYNAMLEQSSTREVAELGLSVPAHFRPFFFEGAAMGYLPRGYLSSGFGIDSAERELLAMNPGFRYLYYVGLGFWLGIRGRPSSILRLTPA